MLQGLAQSDSLPFKFLTLANVFLVSDEITHPQFREIFKLSVCVLDGPSRQRNQTLPAFCAHKGTRSTNHCHGLKPQCSRGVEVVTMIAETGALLRGHFVLLSEMHSSYFFMFSRLGTRVEFRKKLAAELGKRFALSGIESVVAPVSAGGLLVQDVASELKANFAFFDVDDHSRPSAIRRGYSVRGATLIVNDMTTTGEGIERMSKVVRDVGARLVGLGLIATRGTMGTEIVEKLVQKGHKVEALFHLAVEAFPGASCEKCRLGLPFIRSADANR